MCDGYVDIPRRKVHQNLKQYGFIYLNIYLSNYFSKRLFKSLEKNATDAHYWKIE